MLLSKWHSHKYTEICFFFLYTDNELLGKNKETIQFTVAWKRITNLGVNLTKKGKRPVH